MKFFLDENFPKAAIGMLEGMCHKVFDLRGTLAKDLQTTTFSLRRNDTARCS